MLLTLTRDVFGKDATLSTLSVDGKPFGFVCEDEDRGLASSMSLAEIASIKVKNETAIPTGQYRVRRTWSNRYQKLMMKVQAVPGFLGIRVHPGNSEADTAGCLLPGTRRDVTKMTVSHSTQAWTWLDAEVAKVEAAGGEVWIEIRRVGT